MNGKGLVYIRPWTKSFYKNFADINSLDIRTVSDHPNCADISLIPNMDHDSRKVFNFISLEVAGDVVVRDRLLRAMPFENALSLIASVAERLEQILLEVRPNYFLSTTIDCYITHISHILCTRMRIPFVGFSAIILPGYTLLTANGKLTPFRRVTFKEAEDCLNALIQNEKPWYLMKTSNPKFLHFRRWSREVLKLVYFFIKQRISKNYRYNYHVWASQVLVKRHVSIADGVFPNYESLTAVERDIIGRTSVYFPLQFHPECNTEYWQNNILFLSYEDAVIDCIGKLASNGFTTLVKEHPNMLGLRKVSFYRRISEIKDVKFLNPFIPQRQLIRMSDCTITFNSSVAIESIALGKKPVTVGSPFYSDREYTVAVNELTESNLAWAVKSAMTEPIFSEIRRIEFIKKILAGCLHGEPIESYHDPSKKDAVANVERLALSFKEYFHNFSVLTSG